MSYFILNIKNVETGKPLMGLWLSRTQSLVPFVDSYVYRVGYEFDVEFNPQYLRESDNVESFKFNGFYSKGLLSLWANALDAVASKVCLITGKDSVRPPKQITALINDREIFELQLGRQEDLECSRGTLIVSGVHGPGVFALDTQHEHQRELPAISDMLNRMVIAYPNLGLPFFGEKSPGTAKCARCGTVIESRERHEFVTCPCGAISVDGGVDYMRRCGNSEDFAVMAKDDTVRYIDPNKDKETV